MAFALDDLVTALALHEVGPGVVEGANLDIGYHRVFGGQILAQALAAAAGASPEKTVKSLHVLFPREGDTSEPLRYRVETLQEGRTFATTQVVAHQRGKVIAAATASLHVDEGGLHRSDGPPPIAPPAEATARDLGGMVPWETRLVGDVDLADPAVGPPRLEWWMRTPPVADDRHVHQALLAHATDLTLIGTALRPFAGVSQADSTVTLHTAVTSHTLWFHQPFRVDDWLLVVQHSPVVAGGRTFGRGDVFAGDELVASFAQEAMVRQVSPPA
ncbi:MAG TPA: acyl-CoA thioesterase domain-containing protein [Iamia sp.]|jgi:acyl-CoA thioesterase-2|nr:acyl-CoA thioesterase domain-containing protein [Iamia sp.]